MQADTIAFPAIPEELLKSSVVRRLDRACKTLRATPDKEYRFIYGSGRQGIWREVIQEYRDAYGRDDAKIRFIPKPQDVSDCLTALGWCRVLSKQEFKYIWWRSFDNVSFGTIAARIGRSDETARQRWNDAVHRVWCESLREHFEANHASKRDAFSG